MKPITFVWTWKVRSDEVSTLICMFKCLTQTSVSPHNTAWTGGGVAGFISLIIRLCLVVCVCLISLLDHGGQKIRRGDACQNPGDMDKDRGAEEKMDGEMTCLSVDVQRDGTSSQNVDYSLSCISRNKSTFFISCHIFVSSHESRNKRKWFSAWVSCWWGFITGARPTFHSTCASLCVQDVPTPTDTHSSVQNT